MILVLVLVAIFVFFPTSNDDSLGKFDFPIYDVHEHLEEGNLDTLLYAMEENDISYIGVVGSPRYTLTLRNPGFEDFEKNNEFLLGAHEKIIPFPTIDPRDENSLEYFKSLEGAKGLKLYSGHQSSFHRYLGPLDREEILPLYEYIEENNIPVIFHVNPFNESIREEFEFVLSNYPNLAINCPHFCLSSINDRRFRELYDEYPNLYTDISFGSMFAQDGFERFSKSPEKYRNLIIKYQDRILFASDMVLTQVKSKEFASEMVGCYRKMLELSEYECNVEGFQEDFSVHGNFTGLNLNEEILRKIYYENPTRFLEGNFEI